MFATTITLDWGAIGSAVGSFLWHAFVILGILLAWVLAAVAIVMLAKKRNGNATGTTSAKAGSRGGGVKTIEHDASAILVSPAGQDLEALAAKAAKAVVAELKSSATVNPVPTDLLTVAQNTMDELKVHKAALSEAQAAINKAATVVNTAKPATTPA